MEQKKQPAGIGADTGSCDAFQEAVRSHGGLAAAMAAAFSKDLLAKVGQIQGAGRVSGDELHGASLTAPATPH